MKMNNQSAKLILACFMLFQIIVTAKITNAQTTVLIYYAGDSVTKNCPLPQKTWVGVSGTATNYSPTDSMVCEIEFGDGTSQRYAQIYNGYFNFIVSHTYSIAGVFTPTCVVKGPDGNADTAVATKPMVLGNVCDTIQGFVYEDKDLNCQFSSADSGLSMRVVYLNYQTNKIQHVLTDSTGRYKFFASKNHQFEVQDPFGRWSSGPLQPFCPASGFISQVSAPSAGNDFGYSCYQGYELEINGSINGSRPGMPSKILFWSSNSGCNSVNAYSRVIFDDPKLTYTSHLGGLPVAYINADTVAFYAPNLSSASNSWSINGAWLNAMVSPSAQFGDTLCMTLTVDPLTNDFNTLNNSKKVCVPVRYSYDPNIKTVHPLGIGATGNVAPDTWFTYTIHFQNTGNDTAYNIYIMDTIDASLDLSTLQVLNGSHYQVMSLTGNIVRFNFSNIMLVDSATNEPLSHGWVMYKVKTKGGLSNGTQITNSAGIYFDLNTPIITNTTLNTIDLSLAGINDEPAQLQSTSIYPNPATEHFWFKGETSPWSLDIIDISGKTALQFNRVDAGTPIIVRNLAHGVYAVRIYRPGKVMMGRLLVDRR